jgi:hypothetical protein
LVAQLPGQGFGQRGAHICRLRHSNTGHKAPLMALVKWGIGYQSKRSNYI